MASLESVTSSPGCECMWKSLYKWWEFYMHIFNVQSSNCVTEICVGYWNHWFPFKLPLHACIYLFGYRCCTNYDCIAAVVLFDVWHVVHSPWLQAGDIRWHWLGKCSIALIIFCLQHDVECFSYWSKVCFDTLCMSKRCQEMLHPLWNYW